MGKTALITGVTGQDGAYLSQLLLRKGYTVHGLQRRSSLPNTGRIESILEVYGKCNPSFFLHYGELTDMTQLVRIIQEVQPDEIYNLAAMSHVQVSFETPEYTANADGLGMLRILEAVRLARLMDRTRIYQASSSELYGLVQETPQKETTPFYPRSPYAVAKLYAYWITVNYREAYGMFACNGILFNHESPLRGETFVTRKITRAATRIVLGLQECLHLGNMNSKRDWGHAEDYVEAMWLILQQEQADDYVIATGITTTVREFVVRTFAELGVELAFHGDAEHEVGVIAACNDIAYQLPIGKEIVKVSELHYRPTEVDLLLGDSSKARRQLGWLPKYDLPALVKEMVSADLKLAQKEIYLYQKGYTTEPHHD
jgi:GDPmannose 4,6-dehydratase